MPPAAGADRPHQSSVKPTPFHGASAGWNATNTWTISGDYTVSDIYSNVTDEYEGVHAFAAMRDLTPLPKYIARGKKVLKFLAKLGTASIDTWQVGRSYQTPVCDENGYVIDILRIVFDNPGTVYLIANIPLLVWLTRCAETFDVQVREVTDNYAVLGLYGPRTHDIMASLDRRHLDRLEPDTWSRLQSRDIEFNRLVYEGLDQVAVQVWGSLEDAFVLWERLMRAGRDFGLRPVGERVYDQCRIEAGELRTNLDFISPQSAIFGNRPRTPFELQLDEFVDFEGAYYNGRTALVRKRYLHRSKLVGLYINGRRPATGARLVVDGRTVGIVTSSTWSPRFMSAIGIATISPRYAVEGTEVVVEVAQTYELDPQFLQRTAVVSSLPFH